RSPGEFYQLDLEMSFVTQQDVFDAVEPVIRGVFEEFSGGKPVTQKFPLIPYADAIQAYGTDKPDLRNPIRMQDVSAIFRGSEFRVFARILENPKAAVWAIPAPGAATRSFCDRMNTWAPSEGQPGLAYIFWRHHGRAGDFNFGGTLDLSDPDQRALRDAADKLIKEGKISAAIRLLGAGPVANNLGKERTEILRAQLGLKDGDAAFFVAGDPAVFVKF